MQNPESQNLEFDVSKPQCPVEKPGAQWYRPDQGLICKQVMLPMFGLLGILIAVGMYQSYRLFTGVDPFGASVFLLALYLTGITLVVRAIWFIRKSLLQPLTEIRQWVTEVRSGEFSARMPVIEEGEFGDLGRDINRLANVLQTLSQDLEAEAKAQTVILKRKTQSLELLYKLTASINESYNLDTLLAQYMHSLSELIHAHAGAVYVCDKANTRLISDFGIEKSTTDALPQLSVRQARQHILRDEPIMEIDASAVEFSDADSLVEHKAIVVPLQYQETIVGFYYLFLPAHLLPLSRETDNILINVGRHLGVAIRQTRLNADADRLVLVEQRSRLANELHDSLAQTIASLRFQVRVLDETLHQGVESTIWQELEKIEGSVDQANEEIRELMARFRAPIIERDVIVSMQKLIDQFESQAHATVFFQNEWEDDDLSPDARTGLVKIVQEALTNTRKHANANNVRVLLRHAGGNYNVLIEDDGIGFLATPGNGGKPGEHIGLNIMRERADSLGAQFQIDSDVGEGTRVSVQSRSSSCKDDNHLIIEQQ